MRVCLCITACLCVAECVSVRFKHENLYLLQMKRDLSWTAVLCALIYLLPFIWSARAKESN